MYYGTIAFPGGVNPTYVVSKSSGTNTSLELGTDHYFNNGTIAPSPPLVTIGFGQNGQGMISEAWTISGTTVWMIRAPPNAGASLTGFSTNLI